MALLVIKLGDTQVWATEDEQWPLGQQIEK